MVISAVKLIVILGILVAGKVVQVRKRHASTEKVRIIRLITKFTIGRWRGQLDTGETRFGAVTPLEGYSKGMTDTGKRHGGCADIRYGFDRAWGISHSSGCSTAEWIRRVGNYGSHVLAPSERPPRIRCYPGWETERVTYPTNPRKKFS